MLNKCTNYITILVVMEALKETLFIIRELTLIGKRWWLVKAALGKKDQGREGVVLKRTF